MHGRYAKRVSGVFPRARASDVGTQSKRDANPWCRVQNGRLDRETANKMKQLLTPEEEAMVVERCFKMQSWGFPTRVYKVGASTRGPSWLGISTYELDVVIGQIDCCCNC